LDRAVVLLTDQIAINLSQESSSTAWQQVIVGGVLCRVTAHQNNRAAFQLYELPQATCVSADLNVIVFVIGLEISSTGVNHDQRQLLCGHFIADALRDFGK